MIDLLYWYPPMIYQLMCTISSTSHQPVLDQPLGAAQDQHLYSTFWLDLIKNVPAAFV